MQKDAQAVDQLYISGFGCNCNLLALAQKKQKGNKELPAYIYIVSSSCASVMMLINYYVISLWTVLYRHK